jgi:tetratricopeptide (TPR) repeat protein
LEKTGTEQIFDRAVAANLTDVRVKNAYTQFCYDQKDYEKAEALYFEVIEIYPRDFVAHNLYAKVLAKTNREPEAISRLERLISEFERIPKPTDGERKNLITSYMTYRSILDVDGRYGFFEKGIFNLLVKDGFRQDSVKEMFVSAEAVRVVKDRYQRLLNVRSLGGRLKRRYADALAKTSRRKF